MLLLYFNARGGLFVPRKKTELLIFSSFTKTTELTYPRAPGVSVTSLFLSITCSIDFVLWNIPKRLSNLVNDSWF